MSLSGRDISPYSSVKGMEHEVLFAPGSQFLVCSKSMGNGIMEIYMREVVMGNQENMVLWIDE
jgi:hypothetical protein